jgi:hypothetical protein
MIDGMLLVGAEQSVPKLALKLRLVVAIMLDESFDHGEFILCTFDAASRTQDLRRHIVHFNATEHPTAQWTAQQLVEAFPFDTAPLDDGSVSP